ncbi:MAG: hypothetical protein NT105_00460 [Verrucomicrobia bacterium]|nr:hypothetical protein [Verrucomicrobiota bacterium]
MNTTLRSKTGGSPAKALLGIYSLCIAALLAASNEASWAAESGTTAAQPKAAGDVGTIRNKNIRILIERTTITKGAPKGDPLDSIWVVMFLSPSTKQLNAEGRGDGNTFDLLIEPDPANAADFHFRYRFDHTKGTATLRMSDKDDGLIHEFKATTNYPAEDVVNKMKATDADKIFAGIYADLHRQAYAWIRNGWRKE